MITKKSLLKFNKALKEFQDKVDIAPGLVAKRVAFEMFDGVVRKTPVDLGYARVNWNLAQDAPDPSLQEAAGGGPPPLPTLGHVGKYPSLFISNNVPYIIPLEEGHSKQSGKGFMVRRTLADIQSNLEQFTKDLD